MAGDSVRIDRHSWQVLIGHGHAEHVALYCVELGVLISGDMLLPRISTNISVFAATPADALRWYLESLDDLARKFRPKHSCCLRTACPSPGCRRGSGFACAP
jgi:glyoxylase-like metal-dependent hydrolase (beta-lactamase superfamily II)